MSHSGQCPKYVILLDADEYRSEAEQIKQSKTIKAFTGFFLHYHLPESNNLLNQKFNVLLLKEQAGKELVDLFGNKNGKKITK